MINLLKVRRKSNPYVLYASALIVGINGCAGNRSIDKPNILFIMSDDHTSQAIGAYNDRFTIINPTPNIDQLAKEGIIFRQNFCTNSISTPSRATIITGQYSNKNGVLGLDGALKPENQYLPIEMKKAGYQTAIIGKWHLKHAPSAFDYYNVLVNQGEYFDPVLFSNDTTGKQKREFIFSNGIVREEYAKKYNGHSTDVITDLALEWFKVKREPDKPFFFCLHYKAPHDMFEYAPRYENYLANVEFPEPANLWNQDNWGSVGTRGINDSLRNVIGSSIGKRNIIRNMGKHMNIDPSFTDSIYKKEAYQEYMRRYFRCVKGIDDNIGRLIKFLKDEGLMDKTIIIYTADQGIFLGEHDFIDKRWMYDEAIKMPLIVRYPKEIKAGTSCDWLTNNTDYAPTLLDFSGVNKPDYMQGFSLRSAMSGNKEPADWRKTTYYRYYMHMAHNHNNPAHLGIRSKDYKLILFYGQDYDKSGAAKNDKNRFWRNTPVSWEFYDLRNDPGENINQYENPKFQKIIADMKSQIKDIRLEIGDEDDQFPHLKEIIDFQLK